MRQARNAAIAGVVAAMLVAAAPPAPDPIDSHPAEPEAVEPQFSTLQPAAHSWRAMSTHAPQLRPVLGAALAAIPRRAPLAGIFRAEQQMLGSQAAYRLILVLADGSKWRVTLLPRADGTMRASTVEPVP